MSAQIEGGDVSIDATAPTEKKKPGPQPWSDEKKAEERAKREAAKEAKTDNEEETPVDPQVMIDKMNDMCQRQWDGQSQNLGVAERSARIKMSIKKHGWVDIVGQLNIDERQHPSLINPGKRRVKDFL